MTSSPVSGNSGRDRTGLRIRRREARAALAQRRKVLDDANAIAAYAREMKDFLEESELTERRAFIETFVKEILVVPGDALLRYTVPMPDDSMVPGNAILSTVHDGGPSGTVLQTLETGTYKGAHMNSLIGSRLIAGGS